MENKVGFSFGDLTKDVSFTKLKQEPVKQSNTAQNPNPIREPLKTKNYQYFKQQQKKQFNKSINQQSALSKLSNYQRRLNIGIKQNPKESQNVKIGQQLDYNPTVEDIEKKYGLNKNQTYKSPVTPQISFNKSSSKIPIKRAELHQDQIESKYQKLQSQSQNKLSYKRPDIISETGSTFLPKKLEHFSPQLAQSCQKRNQQYETQVICKWQPESKQLQVSDNPNTQAKLNAINELNEKINSKMKSILKGRKIY